MQLSFISEPGMIHQPYENPAQGPATWFWGLTRTDQKPDNLVILIAFFWRYETDEDLITAAVFGQGALRSDVDIALGEKPKANFLGKKIKWTFVHSLQIREL